MDVVVIIILVLLTGLFAMAEMALLTSRKTALEQEAKKGDSRAKEALKLKDKPDNLLSSIQLGFTLLSILTGLYSGDKIVGKLTIYLEQYPVFGDYTERVATILVVSIVTYLTLVFGELVPKKIGLSNAVKLSMVFAKPMSVFSMITRPIVNFLAASTKFVIRLLGVKIDSYTVTEEEIKVMIQEGTNTGNIDEAEQELIDNVFMLGDRKVATLMTPRYEIEWIDVDWDYKDIIQYIYRTKHNTYPVCKDDIDRVEGMIYLKDVFTPNGSISEEKFKESIRKPFYLHENVMAYKALDKMKENKVHNALVVDEYGVVQGLVTISDFITALVGETPQNTDDEEAYMTQRNENSWFIDGAMPFAEFVHEFGIDDIDLEEHDYNTLAGLMLDLFGEIPNVGSKVDWNNFEFEIVDMDQKRIDKLLVTQKNPEETAESNGN